MKITFRIDGPPPLEVELERDPFFGTFTCRVNGKKEEIRSPLELGTHFSLATSHHFEIGVGEPPQHLIEIEHSRPRWFGGLRPQRYIVKVDGEQVADRTGY
jgi:hypothetical protein